MSVLLLLLFYYFMPIKKVLKRYQMFARHFVYQEISRLPMRILRYQELRSKKTETFSDDNWLFQVLTSVIAQRVSDLIQELHPAFIVCESRLFCSETQDNIRWVQFLYLLTGIQLLDFKNLLHQRALFFFFTFTNIRKGFLISSKLHCSWQWWQWWKPEASPKT